MLAIQDLVVEIQNSRILRGISLDPATPVETIAGVADKFDVAVLLAERERHAVRTALEDTRRAAVDCSPAGSSSCVGCAPTAANSLSN